jgi:hypothetical protein
MVTHGEPPVRKSGDSEHIVQLFDTPESLGESVAAFLHEGLLAGGDLLVVASPPSVQAISIALEHRGLPIAALMAEQRLTLLDVHATLDAVLRAGSPDAVLFDAHLGEVVTRMSGDSRAPLRMYGELVELMAEQGNFRAAEGLEDLWNALGTRIRFSLLCGYSAAHFAAPNAGAALNRICARHTRVDRSQADLLGNWLLELNRTSAMRP